MHILPSGLPSSRSQREVQGSRARRRWVDWFRVKKEYRKRENGIHKDNGMCGSFALVNAAGIRRSVAFEKEKLTVYVVGFVDDRSSIE